MKQQIIRSLHIINDLSSLLYSLNYNALFVLTDKNTQELCLPSIQSIPEISAAKTFSISAGDVYKTVESLTAVWEFLSDNGADRKSILINLGGGMLTDLGGFAAATFKRGIRFINIPTTLLGAVDAAVGGKTGINFNGLKNEIGVFFPATAVLIDACFFQTLEHKQFLSGYAEMLKHALLQSKKQLNELLHFDLNTINYHKLTDLLFESVLVKEQIVEKDPTEQGVRKSLNFGHTFGHAFESMSHKLHRPIPHGYAVAWGMICELYLSFIKLGFNNQVFMQIANYIKDHYGTFVFDCSHYPYLYELMLHDKKNEKQIINFTLLKNFGDIAINQMATKKEINDALDIYREI